MKIYENEYYVRHFHINDYTCLCRTWNVTLFTYLIFLRIWFHFLDYLYWHLYVLVMSVHLYFFFTSISFICSTFFSFFLLENNFWKFLTLLFYLFLWYRRERKSFYIGILFILFILCIKWRNLIVQNIMNIKIKLGRVEMQKNFFKRKMKK